MSGSGPGEWRGAAAGSGARGVGMGLGGGFRGAGWSAGARPGRGGDPRGLRGPGVGRVGAGAPGMAGSRLSLCESAGLGSETRAVAALCDPYSLFPLGLRLICKTGRIVFDRLMGSFIPGALLGCVC